MSPFAHIPLTVCIKMMRLTIKPLVRSGVKKLTKQHIRNNNEEQDTATTAATAAIVGDDDGPRASRHGPALCPREQGTHRASLGAAAQCRQHLCRRYAEQRTGRIQTAHQERRQIRSAYIKYRLSDHREAHRDKRRQEPGPRQDGDEDRRRGAQGDPGGRAGTQGDGQGRHLYI